MAAAEAPKGELRLVVRVVKADIVKNFESFGKMDPYATVSLEHEDGSKIDVGQTRTDWNAHMHPVWNHTCPGQPPRQAGFSGSKVVVTVYEDDVVGTDDVIGIARIPVAETLGAPNADGEATGNIHQLALRNGAEETGKVAVQVMLLRQVQDQEHGLSMISADLFESPVQRLGVSGGTAPFFRLVMKDPGEKYTKSYFIGKDLSHATDEITFYEQLADVKKGAGGANMLPLLNFCFEYLGVANCQIAVDENAKEKGKDKGKENGDPSKKDLLVLANLFDGAKKLRLLDIKIGQKTADAGWQGKSRTAAMRQKVIDGLTNSAAEGFRLEGFDNMPPVLTSLDPLLDLSHMKEFKDHSKIKKKAFRFYLQGLAGAEMMMHFLDVHQEPAEPEKLNETLSPTELVEIVLSEIAKRLARLSIACRLAPVPQKWIGSSVALGFDAGELPPRSTGEATTRKKVKVSIFDWGRSELNSMHKHQNLSEKHQRDRAQFWCFYVGGIDRLAFEAARAHYNRFNNADGWQEITCVLFDFDSVTRNDMLGLVRMPVAETPETTAKLCDVSGRELQHVLDGRESPTLTYSLSWRSYPAGSRLSGAWRLKIVKANNLPRRDIVKFQGTSDPYVEIIATSKDGKIVFRQQTQCFCRNLDPVYDEVLEIPVAAKSGLTEAALSSVSPELIKDIAGKMPPEEKAAHNRVSAPEVFLTDAKAIDWWADRLDSAASNVETCEAYFSGSEAAQADDVPRSTSCASLQGLKLARGGSTDTKDLNLSLQAEPDMGPDDATINVQDLPSIPVIGPPIETDEIVRDPKGSGETREGKSIKNDKCGICMCQ